jgi:hypothetical protein
MGVPNNFEPSWVNQRRDNDFGGLIFIAICAAIGWWLHKHWYSKAVRFVTGAGIGYLVGLVGIGALFAGNQSSAAVRLTMALSAIPAIGLGEHLAKFTGKDAEDRHYAGWSADEPY